MHKTFLGSKLIDFSLVAILALIAPWANADISRTTGSELFEVLSEGFWGYEATDRLSSIDFGNDFASDSLIIRAKQFLPHQDAERLVSGMSNAGSVDYIDLGCMDRGILTAADALPDNILKMSEVVSATIFLDALILDETAMQSRTYRDWLRQSLRISEDIKSSGSHEGLPAYLARYKIMSLFETMTLELSVQRLIDRPIVVEMSTECGGGDSFFTKATFSARPDSARIYLINKFLFRLCELQSSNPWDVTSCDGWIDVDTYSDYAPLLGQYAYVADWGDGSIRQGTIVVPVGEGFNGPSVNYEIRK